MVNMSANRKSKTEQVIAGKSEPNNTTTWKIPDELEFITKGPKVLMKWMFYNDGMCNS